MSRVLDDAEMAAWLDRLSGGLWTRFGDDPAGATVPAWFAAEVLRLEGQVGMLQLSNFGTMKAHDPDAFEAALLRRPIGATMLYSTLQTAHTVTYDGGATEDEDIIIVGVANQGGERLHTASGVQFLSVGRMGFMSSLGASTVEHLGISDTTGVVVPVSAVPGYREVLAQGAATFPDSPLTRAAGASFGRMLFEWSRDPDQGAGAVAGTEASLIALVRGLFRQFPADGETDRASELRAEAARIIEQRHREPAFGIEELASAMHMSRRQLFRLFAGTEETVAGRLSRRRLVTAREELLAVPLQDLATVAARSGFADAAALRAQFSRHLGLSPRAFRHAARSRPPRLAEAMLLSDEQAGPPGGTPVPRSG